MRLTSYTDYALRLLMYLAAAEGPATIAEIAQRFRISRTHLMKIAFELGVAGYLQTSRGRRGGLRLARPPAEIGVGDVVRATEGAGKLLPCLGEHDRACPLWQACVLKQVVRRAELAFLEVLDAVTLADLAAPRTAIHDALGLDRPLASGA